jgi:hypothetical protein
MKTTIFALAILTVIMTSCTTVKFDKPQPADTNELKSFSSNLIGTFVGNSNDTLVISDKSFNYGSKKSSLIHIDGNLTNGQTVLKMSQDNYVLSLKDSSYWIVVIIKGTQTGLSVKYISLDKPDKDKEAVIKKIQDITKVKEIKKEGKVDYYLLAPTKQEFEKMLTGGVFSDTEEFKKIK